MALELKSLTTLKLDLTRLHQLDLHIDKEHTVQSVSFLTEGGIQHKAALFDLHMLPTVSAGTEMNYFFLNYTKSLDLSRLFSRQSKV